MNTTIRLLTPAMLGLVSCAPAMMPSTDICKGRNPGDLVVTEVMADPDGTDTGAEWFELHNTTSSAIDLRGYTVTYRQGSSAAKSHTIRASVTVPPRGYVALGDVRSGPNPAWVAYSYGDDLGGFNNSSGTVGVRCAMATLHEFSYTRSRPGRARMLGGGLDPDATLASSETNWCDAPLSTEYAPRNVGTPGGPNPMCVAEAMLGTCLEGGTPRAIYAAEPGDLVITEVMATPRAVSDTLGEWFEVYATTDVDLNGLTIATSTSRTTLSSSDCLSVRAQSYNLLSRSGDSFVNGGLPAARTTYSLSLSSANERLRLLRGDAGIDEASFFASERGVSWQLDPALLANPDEVRSSLNDQPSAFCKASMAWPDGGGDFGTPGAFNAGCALDAGVAFPDSGIVADCAAVTAGDLVVSEVMIDPASGDTGLEWFELHNTTDAGIDIAGFTLFYRQGSSAPRTHVVRESLTVPARGSLAFGDIRSGPNPTWIRYAYGADLGALNNSTGTVGVRCEAALVTEYTWTRAARSGRSRMVGGPTEPSAARIASEANWCDTPTGSEYTPGNTGTPGAANPMCGPEAMTGTCIENGSPRPIVGAEPGDLIITELMDDPGVAADSLGEWFEVYATTDVDLNGLSVGTAGTTTTTLNSTTCVRLAANTYGIVARSNDPFVNGSLPPALTTSTLALPGGPNLLRLFRGDAGIDEARYVGSMSGRSLQLSHDLLADPATITPAINDAPERFCHSLAAWPDGGGDFGSPAAMNASCDGGTIDAGVALGPNECLDATSMMPRAIERPVQGDLVITEAMARPSAVSATVGEWFEVLVNRDVDLNGVVLANDAFTGGVANSTTLTGATCRRVTAGSYLVFARNDMAASNGGLPAVAATFTFALADSNPPVRNVRLFSQATELDAFVYTLTSTAPQGASVQLKAGSVSHTDNDVLTNLCTTPVGTVYGAGDRGTPGLANVACP